MACLNLLSKLKTGIIADKLWVDFWKAYDIVFHALIIKALKLMGATPYVNLLLKSTIID